MHFAPYSIVERCPSLERGKHGMHDLASQTRTIFGTGGLNLFLYPSIIYGVLSTLEAGDTFLGFARILYADSKA